MSQRRVTLLDLFRIMVRIKPLVFTVVALVALCQLAFAQSPSKIISKTNKALGGERALKAAFASQRTGTIRRISDGATGRYTLTTDGTNKFVEMFDIAGFEYAMGYNGRSGWKRDSLRGLSTFTGDAAKDIQAIARYLNARWLAAKSDRTRLSLGTARDIDGKRADAISLISARGSQITVYIDPTTFVPIREEFELGDAKRSNGLASYSAISGAQTPMKLSADIEGVGYEITIDSARYGVNSPSSTFEFPRTAGEPITDIPKLLDEIRANADKIEGILENYSYTETRIDREPSSTGQLIERSSEKRLLTFYKGYRINRLVEKNGKALSASDQAKEDKDVEKQVAEIEKKIAEKEAAQIKSGAVGQPKGEGRAFGIGEALKGSLLLNPRRERYKDREVIVFDYEPNPSFKPQTRNEKLFALCSGAVWVDAEKKQVVRLDAQLTKSAGNFLAKAKRGASFSLENELVNNEIWLPAKADVDLSIKILFAGININVLILSNDYRRFTTDVKEVTVGDEKNP